ncbi:hypothetical protein Aperf_G00000003413 [Anoplocephala perfoliata]
MPRSYTNPALPIRGHRICEVFWNAFMAKPAIDLGALPDFLRIVFSVHKDFRVERQWIVKKVPCLQVCLIPYADPAVDTTTQIQILRLLTAATRIPRACHTLTRFHAFPLSGCTNTPSPLRYFVHFNAYLTCCDRFFTYNRSVHEESIFSKRIIRRISARISCTDYLLSQNHTNSIILHEFDFSDKEIIGCYNAFLKSLSLSLRVNNDIMHFFFEETIASFPLYQRALQFFDHSENMVRIAVRTTTLNIFKDHHEACYLYVYAHTSVPYSSHLAEEIRRTILTVKDSFCLKSRLANRGCFGDLVAETSDHLHYIDDIFALGVTEPTNVPCLVLLLRLFLPIYVHSLTRRHPPKDPSHANSLFHVIAMFLLAQVFTILHQPELIRILTEAILIASDTFNVLAFLRAAQYGKRAVKSALPGHRLQTLLQTISTACGVVDPGKLSSSSLNEDIARRSKSIEDFQAGIKQSYDEESPCNSVLITKLLDIINDAVKMCSRVTCRYPQLGIVSSGPRYSRCLSEVSTNRKPNPTASNGLFQMQKYSPRSLPSELSVTPLRLSERNHIALQRFRFLLRPSLISATSLNPSYRAQKLDPSKLLENTAFLFSHTEDAFKLFTNHSGENLLLSSSSSSSNSASTKSIQHIIAVYHCLKGYLCSYIFLNGELKSISVSNIESLNEVTAPGDRVIVAVSESIDTAGHQIFSCEVTHQNGVDRSSVTVCRLMTEAGITLSSQLQNLSSTLTDKLLSVPERLRSSPTQTPMSKDASRLRFPLMPTANKATLKTVGSVPAILLRKAATAHTPTAPHQRPNETNISSQSSS